MLAGNYPNQQIAEGELFALLADAIRFDPGNGLADALRGRLSGTPAGHEEAHLLRELDRAPRPALRYRASLLAAERGDIAQADSYLRVAEVGGGPVQLFLLGAPGWT